MRNIKLVIQYDGTDYAGWQFQKNATSIQEVIENAIRKITGESSRLISASRTDAGVHAEAQVANFKTGSKISLKNLRMALNSILPDDIAIIDVKDVKGRFNSKNDARSKLYRYTIVNGDILYPLMRDFAAKCFYRLDVPAMKRGSRFLIGRHDFKSFQRQDREDKGAVRTVKNIRIEKEKDLLYIYIEADGFLYNMVRNIIGTLIEVGRGKITPSAVKDILLKKDRRSCGPTVPAKGLCLVKVKY